MIILMDRRRRSLHIEKKDKRLYRLYRRYWEVNAELKEKYNISLLSFIYSFSEPVEDINGFLHLRDEAKGIDRILYGREHHRYIKYVKGGGTFFYIPMLKKERRKSLRKFRLKQLAHYIQIYEEEKSWYTNS